MVQFDNQYRQIKIKIVYYGPALGGKTTCLQHIHSATDPQRRTKLYSLATSDDRTLFFDLLSLDLGRVRGYRLAMQLYTVPGQVQYNATRRTVLSGADGVVFVADSQVNRREANIEALDNLWDNLLANGIDRERVPLVIQHNKRDLSPVLELDEMNRLLNPGGFPSFPTVAVTGKGVLEGFAAIGERTLASVADKLGVAQNPQAVARLKEQLRRALQPYMEPETPDAADTRPSLAPPKPTKPGVERITVTPPAADLADDEPLSKEILVGEAVRANMEMTDLNTRLDTMRRQLEHKVVFLEKVGSLGRRIAGEHDPDKVLALVLKATTSLLRVQASGLLLVPGSNELRAAALHQLEADPLLATIDDAGEPLALALAMSGTARLISPGPIGEPAPENEDPDGHADDGLLLEALQRQGFASGLAAPLVVKDRPIGLLTAYATADRDLLDEDDLKLATVLAATAAMGHSGALAWHRMEELNRDLESQVEQRTARLRESMDESEQLARDLSEKNLLLERAYDELSELDRLKDELLTRISHELKAPVSSLLTATRILLRNQTLPPARIERFIGVVRSEGERLSEIVQSTIQAAVLASPKKELVKTDVPVQDLFKRAITPLRSLSQQRDVRLQVLIPSSLGTVICNGETMEIALRAVIKNAIEFSRKGGNVKVELRRLLRDGVTWLLLRVSDVGVGLAETDIDRAFDAFWQGGNVLTGQPRGIGLGLTIAKRVVERHRGSISLESTVGEGTKVTVAIPQGRAPGKGASQPGDAAAPRRDPADRRPDDGKNNSVSGGPPRPVTPTGEARPEQEEIKNGIGNAAERAPKLDHEGLDVRS